MPYFHVCELFVFNFSRKHIKNVGRKDIMFAHNLNAGTLFLWSLMKILCNVVFNTVCHITKTYSYNYNLCLWKISVVFMEEIMLLLGMA